MPRHSAPTMVMRGDFKISISLVRIPVLDPVLIICHIYLLFCCQKRPISKRGRGWPFKKSQSGQWLWLSWQSGYFQLQRSAVQNQSSAKLILSVNCLLYRKDENKEKEAENGPFKKLLSNLLFHARFGNYITAVVFSFYLMSLANVDNGVHVNADCLDISRCHFSFVQFVYFSKQKKCVKKGGSPGLVVKGGDS